MLAAIWPVTKVPLTLLPATTVPGACTLNNPRFCPCKLPPKVTKTSLAVVLARDTDNSAPGIAAQAALSAV